MKLKDLTEFPIFRTNDNRFFIPAFMFYLVDDPKYDPDPSSLVELVESTPPVKRYLESSEETR